MLKTLRDFQLLIKTQKRIILPLGLLVLKGQGTAFLWVQAGTWLVTISVILLPSTRELIMIKDQLRGSRDAQD